MNKEEYLQKLEQHLKKYLSKEEIKDILMDYNEYFEDGRRQNKSDIEISAKLGDPEVIASQFTEEIKEEMRKKHNDDIEKIKETTSSVINNIKEKAESIGKNKNVEIIDKHYENKSILSSIMDLLFKFIKCVVFLMICFFALGFLFTLLGAIASGIVVCIVGGVLGLVFSLSMIGFITVFAIIAGVFGSIFIFCLGILLVMLFIIIVKCSIEYFVKGFNLFFRNKGGVLNA